MYARKEWRDVRKKRITLDPENMKALMAEFNLARNTTLKYLNDIDNQKVTAPARNEVLIAAINKYHGRLVIEKAPKYVVVINMDDEPENHLDEQ